MCVDVNTFPWRCDVMCVCVLVSGDRIYLLNCPNQCHAENCLPVEISAHLAGARTVLAS